MSIRFRCPCGAILSAEDKYIDAVKPCPKCHLPLRIPHAASTHRLCSFCKQEIPHAHTIWIRGRRVCWKCMPPGSVHLDMQAFHDHRKNQLVTIQKSAREALHYYQYHAPFEAAHNEVQVTADELVLEDKDWDRITPVWRDLGLIPFDMGSFSGVSLNIERFRAKAEESRRYIEPLLAFVKLADELPTASVPKEALQAKSG
jgi:hypothetical protein